MIPDRKKTRLENILPIDGEVYYYGCILSPEDAADYVTKLLGSISWTPDQVILFGKLITTKRKVAWYADQPYSYKYSNISRQALPWTSELLALKALIEKETQETYNACLMNLYHNGREGMGWHSDGEKELKKEGTISSLSLGAERCFSFKHKSSKEVVSIVLHSGSLLVMKGSTQSHWLHCLPPRKKIHDPRINLTFRTINSSEA